MLTFRILIKNLFEEGGVIKSDTAVLEESAALELAEAATEPGFVVFTAQIGQHRLR